jgi:hypothetical protein
MSREEYRISAQQNGLVILRYDTENEKLFSARARSTISVSGEYVGREFCGAFDSIVMPESREDLAAFGRRCRRRTFRQGGDLPAERGGMPGCMRLSFQPWRRRGGARSNRDYSRHHDATRRMAAYQRWQSLLAASDGTFDAMLEINLSSGMIEAGRRIFGVFRHCRGELPGGGRARPLSGR